MLEKIFRKHYSKKYSYVLDAIFLFFSIEIILFLIRVLSLDLIPIKLFSY